MNQVPLTEEIAEVARRVIWFEDPQQAIADIPRFVAYVMTYGTHEDMKTIRQYLSDDDLREALDKAPPGIIDERSWAYWNVILDRYPPPPIPQRELS